MLEDKDYLALGANYKDVKISDYKHKIVKTYHNIPKRLMKAIETMLDTYDEDNNIFSSIKDMKEV